MREGMRCYWAWVRPLYKRLIYVVLPLVFLAGQAVWMVLVGESDAVVMSREGSLRGLLPMGWAMAMCASVFLWGIGDCLLFPGVYQKQMAGMEMMRASALGKGLFVGAVRAELLFKGLWYFGVFACLYLEACVLCGSVGSISIVRFLLICMVGGYAATIACSFWSRHFGSMQMALLANYVLYMLQFPVVIIFGIMGVVGDVLEWVLLAEIGVLAAVFIGLHLWRLKSRLDTYWYRD